MLSALIIGYEAHFPDRVEPYKPTKEHQCLIEEITRVAAAHRRLEEARSQSTPTAVSVRKQIEDTFNNNKALFWGLTFAVAVIGVITKLFGG